MGYSYNGGTFTMGVCIIIPHALVRTNFELALINFKLYLKFVSL